MAACHGDGGPSAAVLSSVEARLAKSPMFWEDNPHIKVVPTTSNPGPLGFWSFAFCCALFMAILTGWVESSAAFLVYGFAFTFAGLGQLIVGLLEYSRNNVFASNAFMCYGFFWLGTALNGTLQAAGVWEPSVKGQQMVFCLWAFITLGFWVQTLILNLALCLLFLTLTILFFLLAALQTRPSLAAAAGAWGIVVAAIAFYIGAAIMCIEMHGRELLPLGAFNWKKVQQRLRGTQFGPVGTRRFEAAAGAEAELPASHKV